MTSPNSYPCEVCNKTITTYGGESPFCDECYIKMRNSIVTCSICCKVFEKNACCFEEDISRHTIWHEKTYTIQGRTPTFD